MIGSELNASYSWSCSSGGTFEPAQTCQTCLTCQTDVASRVTMMKTATLTDNASCQTLGLASPESGEGVEVVKRETAKR